MSDIEDTVPTPALTVAGVSHSYGPRAALTEVSLSVEPGRFTALLGVNGAGKTTLFNLITRLFDTQTGEIFVRGHNIRRAPRRALSELGVVFQSRALDPTMTVAQNFQYQGALQGLAWPAVRPRMEEVLHRVGLADRAGDVVARLSGGQQRRVEIARALVHRPSLLLCDEATVGLDVKSRAGIVSDIHALAAGEGVGILWATHLIDEIWPDDPVAVLHKGRIVASDTARALAKGGDLSEVFLAMTSEAA